MKMFYMGHKRCLLFYGLIICTFYGAQPNETAILITKTHEQQLQLQQLTKQQQEQQKQQQSKITNINYIIDKTNTKGQLIETTNPPNSILSSTLNKSNNGSRSNSNSNSQIQETNTATNLDVMPEYCFYADPKLCYNFYDITNISLNSNSNNNNNNNDGAMSRTMSIKSKKAINYPMTIMINNNNHCHCRSHPTVNNSWYCCNITHITMITSCRHTNSRNNNNNNNNWYNLHIYNMTMTEVDLSLSIFQTLHSLAITNGNISRLVKSFTRVSQIKCLNFSNNSLTNITMKAPPFLRFLNISNNNLTYLPKLKQNQNITLDVRNNKPLLCAPLLETIFRGSFRFVAPNSSYCLLDYNYNWFNSSDYVAISQLEMARRVHSECPIIPGKGNCTCAPEHMLSTGDPMKPEAKIFCRVDCSNLSLTELPPKLPENTFQLDVTNNNITDIGKHFHNNPTYQSIVKLFADNNRIESMHDLEGTKFMDHFQQLHLRNNAISRLPEYLLNNALNSYMGRVIYLGGNKLICDCNSAKSLKQWLLQRSRDIPDYMDIMCRNMPQKVMELQEIKLCQAPHDWTDYVHYIIALEFLLFIALTTKVSYDYWVFKTAGYLPWPANKMPKLPCDCLCES